VETVTGDVGLGRRGGGGCGGDDAIVIGAGGSGLALGGRPRPRRGGTENPLMKVSSVLVGS
jgi:hypothetical protein